MNIKYIIISLIALLVISCGEEASNFEIKTETITTADTSFLNFATDMKISTGMEGFWQHVDQTAIDNLTFSSEKFTYNDKKYSLPTMEEEKYQIVMEALDIDGKHIGRGISNVIDINDIKDQYLIFMAPINKFVSILDTDIGIDDRLKDIEGHTVTNLPDGRVLIWGGKTATEISNIVSIYSPDKQTVVGIQSTINRAFHTATLYYLDDAKKQPRILISGGRNDAGYIGIAEIFNPLTNTIETLGKQEISAKINQAAVYSKGFIYFFGGKQIDNGTTVYSKDILFFNTIFNSFSIHDISLTAPAENVTATYMGGNKIIIAGGNNATTVHKTVFLFDATFGSEKGEKIGNLIKPRTMHQAVRYNGKVYFIGGFSTITGTTLGSSVPEIEQADSTGVFNAPLCSLAKARGRFTANFVNINTIIITGGDNGDGTPIKGSEVIELKFQGCIKSQTLINLNNPRHSSKSVLTTNGLTVIVGGTTTGDLSGATPIEIIAADPRY